MLGNQQEFLQVASQTSFHLQWLSGELQVLFQGSPSMNAPLLVRGEQWQLCLGVHLVLLWNGELGI